MVVRLIATGAGVALLVAGVDQSIYICTRGIVDIYSERIVSQDRLVGFAPQTIARRATAIETKASRQGDEKEEEGNSEEGDAGTNQE